jgi:hypothetical protein
MITRAVVFGSKELSCGHLYGKASIFESILDTKDVEIVEVRSALRSGAGCAGSALFLSCGFLDEKNVKQWRRFRVKLRVIAAGFRCLSSLLIRGNWISFELVGGA